VTFLSGLGEFTETLLGLAFGFGCALLLAYACLRILVGLMTRQQYNVTVEPKSVNAPSHVRSILWLNAAVAGPNASGSDSSISGGATGGPYILPAAAPRNRFARAAKSESVSKRRVVQLRQFAAGRVAQGGRGDGGDAA